MVSVLFTINRGLQTVFKQVIIQEPNIIKNTTNRHMQDFTTQLTFHQEEAEFSLTRQLKKANEEIESLRAELNTAKFANTVLKEENERLNALYQIRKTLKPLD